MGPGSGARRRGRRHGKLPPHSARNRLHRTLNHRARNLPRARAAEGGDWQGDQTADGAESEDWVTLGLAAAPQNLIGDLQLLLSSGDLSPKAMRILRIAG